MEYTLKPEPAKLIHLPPLEIEIAVVKKHRGVPSLHVYYLFIKYHSAQKAKQKDFSSN